MRTAATLALATMVVGCGDPTDAPPDADPAAECANATGYATLVDNVTWGPITGNVTTVSMPAASAGDLLIVTVAGGFGKPVFAGGRVMLQVGLDSSCDSKWATVWSVGNLTGEVSSFNVELSGDGTSRFAVFVSRFRGLAADAGARLTTISEYNHSTGATGARVAACQGAAIVTAAISCGALELAPGAPFTGLGVIDGMSAAAYVPDTFGAYGADWITSDAAATTTVMFH